MITLLDVGKNGPKNELDVTQATRVTEKILKVNDPTGLCESETLTREISLFIQPQRNEQQTKDNLALYEKYFSKLSL